MHATNSKLINSRFVLTISLCLGAHLATQIGIALPQTQSSHLPQPNPQPQSQSQPQSNQQQSKQEPQEPQEPHCKLGNETFQIGERWNPVLDPFGVQVCVLCECSIRQRKDCYETKTTCRKITRECPIIDSCPDGTLPVTIAGQCCKSCVGSEEGKASASSLDLGSAVEGPGKSSNDSSIALVPSVSYNDQTTQSGTGVGGGQLATTTQASILAFRTFYKDDETKDYLSMVKTLQPCQPRDTEKHTSPTPVKNSKKGRNDLNGIDSRLAFKSLHEVHHNQQQQQQQHSSAKFPPSESNLNTATNIASDLQDHQHPNDVQPTGSEINGGGIGVGPAPGSSGNRRFRIDGSSRVGAGNRGNNYSDRTGGGSSGSSPQQQQPPLYQVQPNMCILGNETYSIGDIWHPNLPPLGIQDCVICNCLFMMKSVKNCYEPIVLCKRLDDDCPKIDVCQDGNKPVKLEGSCCATCPLSTAADGHELDSQLAATISQITLDRRNSLLSVRKNETTLREFRSMPRAMQSCLKREEPDTWHPKPTSTKRKRRKTQNFVKVQSI